MVKILLSKASMLRQWRRRERGDFVCAGHRIRGSPLQGATRARSHRRCQRPSRRPHGARAVRP